MSLVEAPRTFGCAERLLLPKPPPKRDPKREQLEHDLDAARGRFLRGIFDAGLEFEANPRTLKKSTDIRLRELAGEFLSARWVAQMKREGK